MSNLDLRERAGKQMFLGGRLTKWSQNPAQQAAAADSTTQQETKQAATRERLMPRDATGCFLVQPAQVELDGLEPTTPALQTRCSPN